MKFNPTKVSSRARHVLTMISILMTSAVMAFSQPSEQLHTEEDVIAKYCMMPLTKSNVARAITEIGIQSPDIVFRQAMIESGHLKSGLCRDGHNLFGMKRPGSRKTYALKKLYKGHARFESWAHSIADYKLWQNRKAPVKDYYSFLKRVGYAENPRYIQDLRSYKMPQEIRDIFTRYTNLVGTPKVDDRFDPHEYLLTDTSVLNFPFSGRFDHLQFQSRVRLGSLFLLRRHPGVTLIGTSREHKEPAPFWVDPWKTFLTHRIYA